MSHQLNDRLNNLFGQAFSYGTSCFMVVNGIQGAVQVVVALCTGLAGAYLTYRLAGKRKAEGELTAQQARALKLKNDMLESELNTK